ncbi:MAG: hypothetical protein ABSB01_19480 [Streptosporangiaceae bacterium]|jgi:hypothetical protein
MALIYGIWWTSEKMSLSYLAGRVFKSARDSSFYGWYVLIWLAGLLAILRLTPTSGFLAAFFAWLALYRLQDLLFGTIGDAFQFRTFEGSGTSKVVLAIVNIVQIVTIFAIAFLVFTPRTAFSPAAPPSRFGHFYLSWSTLPSLGSGFTAETLRARVLVMSESAAGIVVTVIALGRFLGTESTAARTAGAGTAAAGAGTGTAEAKAVTAGAGAATAAAITARRPRLSTVGAVGEVLGMLAGLATLFAGLAAVIGPHYYPAAPGYPFRLTVHTWGWILLALGALLFAAGVMALCGLRVSRLVGTGLAVLTGIAGFVFLPYALAWSILIVALSVIAIAARLIPD